MLQWQVRWEYVQSHLSHCKNVACAASHQRSLGQLSLVDSATVQHHVCKFVLCDEKVLFLNAEEGQSGCGNMGRAGARECP